jgi:uncharacterized protein YdiU (UPF0061 family)
MHTMNPAFIPRNHRIEKVIEAAKQDNFHPFRELLGVLQRPYQNQTEFSKYQRPPSPDEVVCATFCGT